MKHRERVVAALNHQPTDRVPMDFWAVDETQQKLKDYFAVDNMELVLQKLDVDIREIAPVYCGPPCKTFADGSYQRPMGTVVRDVTNDFCTYNEYASFPMGALETAEEVYAFDFPKPEWWDFKNLSAQIGDLHDEYYIKIETGGLFELAWGLRGFEQFLTDLYETPEVVHAIMDRICSFYCEYVRLAMQYAGDKIDMVYTYDDIATQSSLLLSKQMIEEFIFPYHRKLNAVIKSFGKTIMFHSCGAVYPVIQDLAKLPIDVLNPLQPMAKDMDFEKIKENYGDQLSFHGGICIQKTLPYGTPEDVRQAVRRAVSILGKGGGYILTSAHYIQADTPVENILALYDEGCKPMV